MMKRMFRILLLAGGWCYLGTLSVHGGAGDEWRTVRGDLSPGLRYDYMTTTPSGRLLALTDDGALMYSDSGGTSWTYGKIKVGGVRPKGSFSFLTTIGGSVIAVSRSLVEANQGLFKYVVRSYLYTSSDNGNTWSETVFPIDHVQYGGIQIFGTDIRGLALGPGGNLLAYGTVSGSNNGVILWSIGGAIFRNSGGTWSQVHFGYGPVWKVADADGRAVATAHNAILDSADGGGWNGYVMDEAMVTLSGNPLNSDHLDRLRVTDVEVVGGTYVAQAATFVPIGPNADSSSVDHIYTISSPTPFGPSRNWTAYNQTHFYGKYLKAGTSILGIGGLGQIWKSSNAGASFAQSSTGASIPWGLASGTSASTFVAVESSDVAWRSTNTGSSWSKVFDIAVGPDYFLIGRFAGKLYAEGDGDLWVSEDEGESWQLFSTSYNAGSGGFVEAGGGRIVARTGGASLQVSDDDGLNWSSRTITDTLTVILRGGIARTPTGRLVAPATGRSVSNLGRFYVSDDNGETWTGKVANTEWNEFPTSIVVAESGRILVTTNTFSIFNPALYVSDDDGETWTKSLVLRSTDGLDTVTGDPATKVVSIARMIKSPTGRILAMGDEDEILTSDDEGETWIVRKNLDYNWTGPFMDWELRDIAEVSGRWVVTGNYDRPYPQSGTVQFLLISDDDGATWRQKPFETKQENSFISSIISGADGRLILAGANATVMISESDTIMEAEVPVFSIRENTIGMVPIERPAAISGQIIASYSAVEDTALVNTDFLPSVGTLTWEDGDNAPKMIEIETINNNIQNGERRLNLQLRFVLGDGVLGDVEVPVSIEDDEGNGRTSLQFDGEEALYTSESGDTAELGIALERQPAANVTVTVNGEDRTEGILSAKSFTFTPTNWNVQQILTITGVDDNFPDGDHSYDLRFVVTSTDNSFASLPETILSVTNLGDEPYEVGGEFLGGGVPPAPKIFVKKSVIAKGTGAKISGSVTSGVVEVRVKAGKGGYKPAKLKGTRFTFKARGLKAGKSATAKILATNSDGRRAVAKVKILAR